MSKYGDLKGFVTPAIEEVIGGSSEVSLEESNEAPDGYELKLASKKEDEQARLVLNKKKDGRPAPTVTVNAVSREENLFYEDQRMDKPPG